MRTQSSRWRRWYMRQWSHGGHAVKINVTPYGYSTYDESSMEPRRSRRGDPRVRIQLREPTEASMEPRRSRRGDASLPFFSASGVLSLQWSHGGHAVEIPPR